MAKNQTMGNRDLSVEVKAGALEHRGLKATLTRLTNDGAPNPVMPDGTLDTYVAMIGNCMTMTMGGKDTDAKAAFDQVLDQKAKRAPLADGVLMDLAIDIRELAAMGGTPQEAMGDDMPAKATIAIAKRDKALSLHVHVK
jgi:hypothetical protein